MIAIKFPKGGNNLPLTVTMKDSDGSVVDLTGGTVALFVDRGDTSFNQAGVLITPSTGVCQFSLMATGALTKSGRFKARVTAAVGVQTLPSEWFTLSVE